MEKIIEILKEIRPEIDVNSKSLVDEGLLDSFDIVTLVSELIDNFNIDITVEDIIPDNFNSVDSMKELIERKK